MYVAKCSWPRAFREERLQVVRTVQRKDEILRETIQLFSRFDYMFCLCIGPIGDVMADTQTIPTKTRKRVSESI